VKVLFWEITVLKMSPMMEKEGFHCESCKKSFQNLFNGINTPQLKLSLIGLKSGEYSGRNTKRHPYTVTLKGVQEAR